jgi:hypothetical protein
LDAPVKFHSPPAEDRALRERNLSAAKWPKVESEKLDQAGWPKRPAFLLSSTSKNKSVKLIVLFRRAALHFFPA